MRAAYTTRQAGRHFSNAAVLITVAEAASCWLVGLTQVDRLIAASVISEVHGVREVSSGLSPSEAL